ncbi:endo-1,4-beta-xylanase [Sporocytophaga myxococcoides]|uniref:endo-1,4-beta-xylanase n=1 Tax=Sporocytophaga myxococcoides TaxID=153721 RepID=UPI0004266DC3|nr:endo-1,4-beta-xylanase [Sporocytophaga myxococcoides]
MKGKGLLILIFLQGIFTFLQGQTLNYPPSCSITMPHSNAYFKAGTDVEIHVYSTDIGKSANNGTVTKVEFYNGTTLLGEATTHTNYTYKYVWGCVPAGTYTIKAKATNSKGVTFTSVGVVITVGTANVTQRGMSACKGKYLANIIPGAPQVNYNNYWNGVTAENNCKWGPVEGTRDQFNWNGADVCYNHAKNNNMMFRYHALMWASQYPAWFKNITSTTEAREEALEYMTAVAQRFPLSDQVDVINEQLSGHQADNPIFANLLGGTGSTGYDWQIWVFTQARALFPNTKLILNDYGLENNTSAINSMLGLAKALRDRGLIDGFGTQAHCFNVDQTSATQLKSAVDLMATGGVPVFVTELDLNGGVESESNNTQQETSYKTHFPVYWDHPAVAGITIWGYISGATWKTGTGLMSSSGTEKPAFTWLKNYVSGKTSVGYPACATGACTSNGELPKVELTGPANNATFKVGANIALTATASDKDGNITKVEFFNGSTKLGEDATSPYSYDWSSVAEGNYKITAVATDNSGNKVTSAEISITVGNPRTQLITNGEFDQSTSGWEIQNNSSASGTMNVITNGNMSGTNSLKICPATPGTEEWHVQVRQATPLIEGKNYKVSFIAKADAARTMTVSIQHDADPYTTYFSKTVDLTTTSQLYSYEFNATTTDDIAKLKFYIGKNSTCVVIDKVEVSEGNFQLVAEVTASGSSTVCEGSSVVLNANTGTDYTYLWKKDGEAINTATSASYTATQSGSYTVTITASGQSATSDAIEVKVNATPSLPSVTSPVLYCQNASAIALIANGAALKWYAGSSNGTGVGTAPVPVTGVTGTTNYYVSQTVNGCESPRALIAVTVKSLPLASISAVGSTTVVEGNSVVLNANSGTGLSYKWFKDNIQVGTNASYTATSSGSYSVEVSNDAGCKATSTPTAVTVNPNQPSVITINAPVSNENIIGDVVTYDVKAEDPDGTITKVEYYLDGKLVGSSSSSPYVFEYKNASPGNHEVLIKVTDSNGGVTTSSPIKLSVSVTTGVFSGGYKVFTGIVPNPSNESFKITSNMAIKQLRITNIYGAEVEVLNEIPADQTSNVGFDLKGGTYLMTIEYVAGSIEVLKLVKLQ